MFTLIDPNIYKKSVTIMCQFCWGQDCTLRKLQPAYDLLVHYL